MDMQRVRDLVEKREKTAQELAAIDAEMVALFSGGEKPKRKWTRRVPQQSHSETSAP